MHQRATITPAIVTSHAAATQRRLVGLVLAEIGRQLSAGRHDIVAVLDALVTQMEQHVAQGDR